MCCENVPAAWLESGGNLCNKAVVRPAIILTEDYVCSLERKMQM